jgi:hypothetical protein
MLKPLQPEQRETGLLFGPPSRLTGQYVQRRYGSRTDYLMLLMPVVEGKWTSKNEWLRQLK